MREMGGDFLDKEDLENMYGDKPDELAGIYANARKIHCRVRCVDLWEHLRWRGQNSNARLRLYAPKRKPTWTSDKPLAKCQRDTTYPLHERKTARACEAIAAQQADKARV